MVEVPPARWPRRLVAIARRPRIALALKAAVAATLAWEVALRLPAPASDYPFYAPFGAIAMMYPTVAGSARQSLQGLAAVALGALLAVTADAALGSGFLVVTVVVLLGMLMGGLRVLGEHAVYVPVAALFILVIGQGHELEYAAAYAGLFAMGAAIAIAINAVFPSLPFSQVERAMTGLRSAVVAHLEHLADRFDEEPEGSDESAGREALGRPALDTPTTLARNAVQHAQEATRGNIRARRLQPGRLDADYDAFRSLERVVLLIDDLYDLLEDQPWGEDVEQSPAELREPIARALCALVPTVEEIGVAEASAELRAEVDEAIGDLTQALRQRRSDGGSDAEAFVVATIITSLRRCLAVMTPAEQLNAAPA